MAKYLNQYSDDFFVIRNVPGYTGNMVFNGECITDEEFERLFYSGKKQRVTVPNNRWTEYRMHGNAKEILGR